MTRRSQRHAPAPPTPAGALAFALALALALAFVGRAGAQRDACSQYSTCSACASIAACGWCAGSRRCVSARSPAQTACGSSWIASPAACFAPSGPTPGANCAQFTACAPCAQQASCGWCGANNHCMAGGPNGATGCTSAWAWEPQQCAPSPPPAHPPASP